MLLQHNTKAFTTGTTTRHGVFTPHRPIQINHTPGKALFSLAVASTRRGGHNVHRHHFLRSETSFLQSGEIEKNSQSIPDVM